MRKKGERQKGEGGQYDLYTQKNGERRPFFSTIQTERLPRGSSNDRSRVKEKKEKGHIERLRGGCKQARKGASKYLFSCEIKPRKYYIDITRNSMEKRTEIFVKKFRFFFSFSLLSSLSTTCLSICSLHIYIIYIKYKFIHLSIHLHFLSSLLVFFFF